jgi:hypothetical protein
MSQYATWCSFEKAFSTAPDFTSLDKPFSLSRSVPACTKKIEVYVNIPTSKKEMQKETPRGGET